MSTVGQLICRMTGKVTLLSYISVKARQDDLEAAGVKAESVSEESGGRGQNMEAKPKTRR